MLLKVIFILASSFIWTHLYTMELEIIPSRARKSICKQPIETQTVTAIFSGGKQISMPLVHFGSQSATFRPNTALILLKPENPYARPHNPLIVERVLKGSYNIDGLKPKEALQLLHTNDYLGGPIDQTIFIHDFKKKWPNFTLDIFSKELFSRYDDCSHANIAQDNNNNYHFTISGKKMVSLYYLPKLIQKNHIPLNQLRTVTIKDVPIKNIHPEWIHALYEQCPHLQHFTLSNLPLQVILQDTFLGAHPESIITLHKLAASIKKGAFSPDWKNGVLIIDHCTLTNKSKENIRMPEHIVTLGSFLFGPKPGYQIITYE